MILESTKNLEHGNELPFTDQHEANEQLEPENQYKPENEFVAEDVLVKNLIKPP